VPCHPSAPDGTKNDSKPAVKTPELNEADRLPNQKDERNQWKNTPNGRNRLARVAIIAHWSGEGAGLDEQSQAAPGYNEEKQFRSLQKA